MRKANLLQELICDFGAFGAGKLRAGGLQAEFDIALGGHPGQQRVVLEDHAPVRSGSGDRVPGGEYLAGAGEREPCDHRKDC